MNENKFYWIKLKTNFFSREDIDFLLSQPNGAEYVVLYQMLCLNTANNEGRLESSVGEMIVPYNAEKIVRDCKYFDIDTVNVAMTLYKKLGLIYKEDDGILVISNYDDMVGSSKNDEHTRLLNAERQRRYRNKQKQLKCVTVTQDVTDDITLYRNVEIRDKSIENRDIENNINKKENNNISKDILLKEKRNLNNVSFKKPTLDEVKKYCEERKNNIDAELFIDFYESNGWKVGKNSMKDWKACIRTWERNNKSYNNKNNNKCTKGDKVDLSKFNEDEIKNLIELGQINEKGVILI